MRKYEHFLVELEELKNEPVSPFREATFHYWKTIISAYDGTLKYQKSKRKSIEKIDDQEDYSIKLKDFFGTNIMKDQEKMLRVLWKKLKEIYALNNTSDNHTAGSRCKRSQGYQVDHEIPVTEGG